ncbi:MFS transporter [Tsukamurella asaccharolytica]|uniref:MFS transporter n=1 Tax=Tsukamurella asaccharolytica TaxID=2592067 RepID=UPI0013152025|nr:MFS transporter [Tsukamurella asaccharolytica]
MQQPQVQRLPAPRPPLPAYAPASAGGAGSPSAARSGRDGGSARAPREGGPWPEFLASTFGWFDLFLYGTLTALVFPSVFFPFAEDLVLATAMTYLVPFLVRPVGGLFFGHIGDVRGRRYATALALAILAVATMLMALVPSYSTIGIAAPVIVLLLRMVQMAAIGGLSVGASVNAAERAPARFRGMWSALSQSGLAAGSAAASAAVLVPTVILPEGIFAEWVWRAVVLLGAGLSVVLALVLPRIVDESPVFRDRRSIADRADFGAGFAGIFDSGWRGVLYGAGLRFGESVFLFFLLGFALVFAGPGWSETRWVLLFAAVLHCGFIIGAGAASDRIGRRPVLAAGIGLSVVWALVAFPVLLSGSLTAFTLVIVVGSLGHAMMWGPAAAFIGEYFPSRSRFSGTSLVVNVVPVVAGSLVPFVMEWVEPDWGAWTYSNQFWLLSASIVLALAVSGVAVLLAPETRGIDLADVDAHDRERQVANRVPSRQVVGYTQSGEPITGPGSSATNGMAIAALVLGIIGGVWAIPIGHIALSQIRRTGESGRGMAIAGLVLGYVSLVGLIVGLITFLVIIGSVR